MSLLKIYFGKLVNKGFYLIWRIQWLFLCRGKCPKVKLFGVAYPRVLGEMNVNGVLMLRSGLIWNPIGSMNKSSFVVEKKGVLNIGKNVSISNSAIYCSKNITISDNVMIGAGTRIWDTDFHSLNYEDRVFGQDIKKSEAVNIKEGAFIGASVTILKGVTIGKQSIIGACSLVSKDVGDFEVWAGNPAKKIK